MGYFLDSIAQANLLVDDEARQLHAVGLVRTPRQKMIVSCGLIHICLPFDILFQNPCPKLWITAAQGYQQFIMCTFERGAVCHSS
jgi:hypothetical protein